MTIALFVDGTYFEKAWDDLFEVPFMESGYDMLSLRLAVERAFEGKVAYAHYFSVEPESMSPGRISSIVSTPPLGGGFHATISVSPAISMNLGVVEGMLPRLAALARKEFSVTAFVFVGYNPTLLGTQLLTDYANAGFELKFLWDHEKSETYLSNYGHAFYAWDHKVDSTTERLEGHGLELIDLVPLLRRINQRTD